MTRKDNRRFPDFMRFFSTIAYINRVFNTGGFRFPLGMNALTSRRMPGSWLLVPVSN